MVLELNTDICPIVRVGTYQTTLSPDFIFESEWYEWDKAHEEGRITKEELEQLKEVAWMGFDFKKYLNTLGKYALDEIEEFLKDISGFVNVKLASKEYSTYSPKEYNYRTDGMKFYVEVEQSEIDWLYWLTTDNKEFLGWIYDTYKSRPGFISSMPCYKDEFVEAISGKDIERALSMYLMWLLEKEFLDEHGYGNPYQESLLEKFSGNHSEGEFINDSVYDAIIEKIWRSAL